MKKNITLLILLASAAFVAFGQKPVMELTFTAVNNTSHVQLDSVKVMNRTQGGETMIYWPDTTLSLEINPGDLLLCVGYSTFSMVGIPEVNDDISSFTVYQNFPNPMGDQSEISLFIPQRGKVHLMITDLQGKVVLRTERQLDEGRHSFRFIPGGSNFYFLTTSWNGISRSIKMISAGQNDSKTCSLDYLGGDIAGPELKASRQTDDFIVHQSGILDSPETNHTYTFQFATNIPCPGTPTVEYEGQVYNTIQIFSQCWLKENLNVGEMIPGTMEQSYNGTMEKYCYNNEPDSCNRYGGLYQWYEMTQYTNQQGVQGICPQGWHLPTDEEWKVLEGSADSKYGIGDPEWDINWDFRGYDAGMNLKNTSGWNNEGNGTDFYGFSGLPGGNRYDGGSFDQIGKWGRWWSSTGSGGSNAWRRYLFYGNQEILHFDSIKKNGYSVRCLRDD